jgi:NAD(P)-dependent dehydrogenase (short-subunit alcohol dehydrogenase family)
MANALIWGASGAIGSAVINKLKDEGWQTIGITRNATNNTRAADHVIETNFENPAEVAQAVYLVSQEMDEIDLMCYAAGDIEYQKIADMAPEDWRRIMDANLNGVFYTTHHSLPLMSENAHIFILGAVSERMRLPGMAGYAAAKAGLEAFAETLGKEERKKRVSVVRPGAVATPFWEKVPMRPPKDAAPAEKVADKIYAAYLSGHKGKLDLV